MVSIKIGNDERKIESVDSDWIYQQISNRRKLGEPVCVRVLINSQSVNIALESEECPKGQFTAREITNSERGIFELWEKMGLKKKDFHPNTLIDFLLKMNGFR